MAQQLLTGVTKVAPLRSEWLLDPDAWQRDVDDNAKSAGNAQWLQLPAATPHHREVVSRGGHQAIVRPSDGCANAEASVAGPYPADACRPRWAKKTGPPYQHGSLLMDTALSLTERAADRRGWARASQSLSSLHESP